jgi:hypothetical protein
MPTEMISAAPTPDSELDSAVDDTPSVKSSKSVTMDAPSQIANLSEVQLANRKTPTGRSTNLSRDTQISRPEGYVPVGARPSVRLINSSNHITAEWLTEVYEDRGFLEKGGKVTSCNVKPLGEGEGVMGVLAICSVELENAKPHAPKQFVAKFSPVRARRHAPASAASFLPLRFPRRRTRRAPSHPPSAPLFPPLDEDLHARVPGSRHLRRRGTLVQRHVRGEKRAIGLYHTRTHRTALTRSSPHTARALQLQLHCTFTSTARNSPLRHV